MDAHARLAVSTDVGGRTHIDRLRSDPPMVLRPTIATGGEPAPGWHLDNGARVSLAASAAGPVGGDELRLHADVGPGAVLVLCTVAATLALPGPHGRPSRSTTVLRVAENATLLWLPEPLITANGCDHRASTFVDLAPGARLIAREELVLGRHGEPPGTVSQRLRVTRDGRPIHDQDNRLGPSTRGWHGAAVTGGRKAFGSTLVAGSTSGIAPEPATDVAVLPLQDSAVLVTALGDDAFVLRQRLDRYLAALLRGTASGAC